MEAGLHKQVSNRLLEPFMWHYVIVTATEWENFYQQRCNPAAQPEIRAVAEAMREAMENSTPHPVDYGDWHAPYVSAEDDVHGEDMLKVSAARCARVSYLTHDGKRDLSKDIELYDRLTAATPMHASPLEHVARPQRPDEDVRGNLRGWRQLRHQVSGAY